MLHSTRLTRALALSLAVVLGACGTTYDLPSTDARPSSEAEAIFAAARHQPNRTMVSAAAGESRFYRVASRIKPVARRFCEQAFAGQEPVDCNVRFEIDRQMKDRNAYFTYTAEGFQGPVIRFTVPMLQDAQNDDEVAFIMGHEYGHLIGQHVIKQQQQAMAGALLVGVLVAAYDPGSVDQGMRIGATLGQRSYSQTYELESDMLGTRIAAAAGYDPVEGAKFFARAEAAQGSSGALTFWGTHPPDVKRMAMVIATMDEIRGN